MEAPEYNYKQGWPKNIITRLKISASLYSRNYKYVKIGITCDPDRRFKEHKKSQTYKWERMVVVYCTTSVNNANSVEKYFIGERSDFVNKWIGHSGMCESSYYYAYFLLGNKKRKANT